MSEEPTEIEPEDNAPEPEDTSEDKGTTPDTVSKADHDKVIQRRDRLAEKARKLEEELSKFKDKEKPDPVAQANRRIVSTTARTVMANTGITDKDVQKAVLSVLDLSKVEVSEDGEADEDAIEDAISVLRKAFAVKAEDTPRTTRIRATPGGPAKGETDPDVERRRRFLQGKKRR